LVLLFGSSTAADVGETLRPSQPLGVARKALGSADASVAGVGHAPCVEVEGVEGGGRIGV
jgi:hypothetical protein